MSIKVKAKETMLQVGNDKGSYRFILQSETYNTLSVTKVLKEAAKNANIPIGIMQACWSALGTVVVDWATEGHSVPIPGLGNMRFGIRATSVEDVSEVSSKLITSRRVIFIPAVSIKQELANTSISITCYNRFGKVIKTVTSTDKDDIEDEESGSSSSGNDSGGADEEPLV